MTAKLGRPKIPDGERKTEMVSVPLTPTQFALFVRAAERRKIPIAVWLRAVGLRAASR